MTARASRSLSVWIATFAALAILAWGFVQVLELVRVGEVSVFGALLPFLALLLAVGAFWSLHWWGLALAALGALYVAVLSPVGGVAATATMLAFYIPLAVGAVIAHKNFRP